MRRGAIRGFFGLVCLTAILSAGGCAHEEILTEILQTAAIEQREGGLLWDEETVETIRTPEEDQDAPDAENTEKQEEGTDFLYAEATCFAYQNLSEAEQLWYRDIEKCFGSMQDKARLNKRGLEMGLDETSVDKIFQCVLMDHPELFYVEGYTYTKYSRGERVIAMDLAGNYTMDTEQALSRKEEIEEAVQPLLDGAAALETDYEKVKYVYETIIRNTEYDLESPDNQNIYSVFVNHSSVCQGYAKAVQYLLHRMGVECSLVQGIVDTGEGHAWNLVKVDGSYYYVDATWGDASYQPEEEEEVEYYVPEINYDYLCITTEQLLRTHILDSYVSMPVCVDTKDNYYVREGALFTGYDKEQMQRLFEHTFAGDRQDVNVKCADKECYRDILEAMIENREIFDYLGDNSGGIVYTLNEKQLSMTFWVTNE